VAAARLSAAFVYQSTNPRYSRVTGSGLALGELPSSECSDSDGKLGAEKLPSEVRRPCLLSARLPPLSPH
jgi:hypothetical protein